MREAQLRCVVTYGVVCSYCLGRAERLDGSCLRTFALELKEQLAQTLTTYVTSILVGRLDAKETAGPPLRKIIGVLQQVMCTNDTEKLAISVLEIYQDRDRALRSQFEYRSDCAMRSLALAAQKSTPQDLFADVKYKADDRPVPSAGTSTPPIPGTARTTCCPKSG
ncbi:MAG: hypothetical protein WAL97_00440 [Halobacteriota archaeon]